MNLGTVPWSRTEMCVSLEEFAALYEKRPILDNQGGMNSIHMFLSWFALKKLQPAAIIESGVWLGQGTWFFEQACPSAQLYCIDPNLERIQYKSKRALYYPTDFTTHDWTGLARNETLVFFDDHQNAYERTRAAKWFGFKHLIFEDNYPPSQGDCYSLQKVLAHAGFIPQLASPSRRLKEMVLSILNRPSYETIPPNELDAKYLRENVESYYVFPPIFKLPTTRWGDAWNEQNYPTPEPLLTRVEKAYQQQFLNDASSYTWMCYVRLK